MSLVPIMAETLMPNIVPNGLATLFDHTHICDGSDRGSDVVAKYIYFKGLSYVP